MSETFTVVRKDFGISWKVQLLIMSVLCVILYCGDITQILVVLLFSPIACGMTFFFIDPPDLLAVFALPVRRNSHVRGRYASAALMLFLTIGLYEALTLFFRDPLNIRTESLLIAAVMLCLSLLFPLYYRLPRNCALAVTTFIMMMIVSVTFGFAMALTKYGKTIPPEFEIIWRFPFFPPAMAAIASASYIGSLFVSLRIMARKVL